MLQTVTITLMDQTFAEKFVQQRDFLKIATLRKIRPCLYLKTCPTNCRNQKAQLLAGGPTEQREQKNAEIRPTEKGLFSNCQLLFSQGSVSISLQYVVPTQNESVLLKKANGACVPPPILVSQSIYAVINPIVVMYSS